MYAQHDRGSECLRYTDQPNSKAGEIDAPILCFLLDVGFKTETIRPTSPTRFAREKALVICPIMFIGNLTVDGQKWRKERRVFRSDPAMSEIGTGRAGIIDGILVSGIEAEVPLGSGRKESPTHL